MYGPVARQRSRCGPDLGVPRTQDICEDRVTGVPAGPDCRWLRQNEKGFSKDVCGLDIIGDVLHVRMVMTFVPYEARAQPLGMVDPEVQGRATQRQFPPSSGVRRAARKFSRAKPRLEGPAESQSITSDRLSSLSFVHLPLPSEACEPNWRSPILGPKRLDLPDASSLALRLIANQEGAARHRACRDQRSWFGKGKIRCWLCPLRQNIVRRYGIKKSGPSQLPIAT